MKTTNINNLLGSNKMAKKLPKRIKRGDLINRILKYTKEPLSRSYLEKLDDNSLVITYYTYCEV